MTGPSLTSARNDTDSRGESQTRASGICSPGFNTPSVTLDQGQTVRSAECPLSRKTCFRYRELR